MYVCHELHENTNEAHERGTENARAGERERKGNMGTEGDRDEERETKRENMRWSLR